MKRDVRFFSILFLISIFLLLIFSFPVLLKAKEGVKKLRARDYGIRFGSGVTGPLNAITDVKGVLVGHRTIIEGEDIRTGVTAVLPHRGNLFLEKVPGAIYIGNGFGKLAGYTQVRELGQIESPIMLTNTLCVGPVMEGVIRYTLSIPQNRGARSINGVVGECNDGFLSNIGELPVLPEHGIEAIKGAVSGPVPEGNVGGGAGTICHRFKGGIGTSSRVLPASKGGYTIGVLVQTNFGRSLYIEGVPVGKMLGSGKIAGVTQDDAAPGSCMIVIATDAPLDSVKLLRLAKRAMLGLAKTGGVSTTTSGDYIIAFSTAPQLRINHHEKTDGGKTIAHRKLTPFFNLVVEATEEAIINSIFAAQTMTGYKGHKALALPIPKTLDILKAYRHPGPVSE